MKKMGLLGFVVTTAVVGVDSDFLLMVLFLPAFNLLSQWTLFISHLNII